VYRPGVIDKRSKSKSTHRRTSPKQDVAQARRRPSKASPEESTRVTKAFRREEGPHDGITLSWVASLWDPLHRINDQVKGARDNAHVLINNLQGRLHA